MYVGLRVAWHGAHTCLCAAAQLQAHFLKWLILAFPMLESTAQLRSLAGVLFLYLDYETLRPVNHKFINKNAATSGFEMWFAIGSQHLWCRGSQPKHVSDAVLVPPHLMYDFILFFRPQLCHLLYLLTRQNDVQPFRIRMVLDLQKRVGNEPHITALLSCYKLYTINH